MAGQADRILYLGTWDGLYQAEPNGHGYKTRLLGLESPNTPNARWNDHRGGRSEGYGAIRCPVVVDKDDPRRLYAPTNREGMWLSEDGGETWREINRGLVYKEVWSLAQHPRTGELKVGTGPSAFFASTDRGESWVEAAQLRTLPTTKHWTFPGPPFVSHIKDIGLCADDPSLVFGSIEEGGVVRSRDGGHTWDQIDESNGIYDDVHTVSVMPDDHRTLVATTGKGVYRSEDGGDTWALSSDGLERWTYMSHLLVHPARPRVLFTAAAHLGPAGRRQRGLLPQRGPGPLLAAAHRRPARLLQGRAALRRGRSGRPRRRVRRHDGRHRLAQRGRRGVVPLHRRRPEPGHEHPRGPPLE